MTIKKLLITLFALLSVVSLAACGNAPTPMTDDEMASMHNMSPEEFQETKEAAARMNMSIEDHLKMMGEDMPMDHEM